jgi:hypothetical protein
MFSSAAAAESVGGVAFVSTASPTKNSSGAAAQFAITAVGQPTPEGLKVFERQSGLSP